jgi:hypothetical protein
MVKITWGQFSSYDEAKNKTKCVYIHEWKGKAYYIGICQSSVFGGSRRKINGKTKNPRYAISYRHWIDGCLEHGGKLYIGKISTRRNIDLKRIEQTLITQLKPYRQPLAKQNEEFILNHVGTIPLCIRKWQNFRKNTK